MSPPSLTLVGPGRAGGALARLWQASGHWQLRQVLGRRRPQALADELGAHAHTEPAELAATDILLIATPDAAIAPLAAALAAGEPGRWRGAITFHLSGLHSAAALAPLAAVGAHTASAHPLRSFAGRPADFAGTAVGVEGEAAARRALQAAFAAIGGQCFALDPAAKALYHAAAVVASNHLVALADQAQQLWRRAGVPAATAPQLFDTLASGVLANLRQQPPAAALTGPIARGDVDTVAAHLRALDRDGADPQGLYRPLSRQLLALVAARLDERERRALLALLGAD